MGMSQKKDKNERKRGGWCKECVADRGGRGFVVGKRGERKGKKGMLRKVGDSERRNPFPFFFYPKYVDGTKKRYWWLYHHGGFTQRFTLASC